MKKLILIAGAALMVVTPATANAHFHIKGESHSCKNVVFAKHTDFAASGVRAKGVSCHRARGIATSRVTHPETQPVPFTCTVRHRAEGHPNFWLGHSDYRCRAGSRVVVFALS